jgi:ElaB/YqjD/DUF883 family membrane-anchored ribosome-binding protein
LGLAISLSAGDDAAPLPAQEGILQVTLMLDDQALKTQWNQLVEKLRAQWKELAPEDLAAFQGNVEQLVSLIQARTGEAREAIQRHLDRFAAEPVQAMREGYQQAETAIRRHPGEAVAICFGAGLALGVIIGLALRSK